MNLKPGVVCHAKGDRCLGCAHYHGKATECEFKQLPMSDLIGEYEKWKEWNPHQIDWPEKTSAGLALLERAMTRLREMESGVTVSRECAEGLLRQETHAVEKLEKTLADTSQIWHDKTISEKSQKIAKRILHRNEATLDFLKNRVAELRAALNADSSRKIIVAAYQAGYSRGHNDTVESQYNGGVLDEDEAALEWLDEYKADIAKHRSEQSDYCNT
jgi:hypothetical protein